MAVSIDKPFVDWSGNCGNLYRRRCLRAARRAGGRLAYPGQRHLRSADLAGQHRQDHHRPCAGSQRPLQETGDFELDGVTFRLRKSCWNSSIRPMMARRAARCFLPAARRRPEVPGIGTLKATMISAGIPTVFVNAEDIGYQGTELRETSTAIRRRWLVWSRFVWPVRCAWA